MPIISLGTAVVPIATGSGGNSTYGQNVGIAPIYIANDVNVSVTSGLIINVGGDFTWPANQPLYVYGPGSALSYNNNGARASTGSVIAVNANKPVLIASIPFAFDGTAQTDTLIIQEGIDVSNYSSILITATNMGFLGAPEHLSFFHFATTFHNLPNLTSVDVVRWEWYLANGFSHMKLPVSGATFWLQVTITKTTNVAASATGAAMLVYGSGEKLDAPKYFHYPNFSAGDTDMWTLPGQTAGTVAQDIISRNGPYTASWNLKAGTNPSRLVLSVYKSGVQYLIRETPVDVGGYSGSTVGVFPTLPVHIVAVTGVGSTCDYSIIQNG